MANTTSIKVKPLVEPTRAGMRLSGDLDGNELVDASDARLALEIVRGYTVASADQLLADPNQDSQITTEDVDAILQLIEGR